MTRFALSRIISWNRVRGIGELQILTRASYVMLILVPILAACWPAVRYNISQYNQAVVSTRNSIENAVLLLERQVDRAEMAFSSSNKVPNEMQEQFIKNSNEIIESVRNNADAIVVEYCPKTVKNPNLPDSWARAFFASLCVLVGHLLYQMFAPELIRRQSADEFAGEQKNDYASNPSDGPLKRADFHMSKLYGNGGCGSDAIIKKLDSITDPDERHKKAIDLVSRGAYSEYRYLSMKAPVAIVLSATMYLIGLYFAVFILWKQSFNVVQAAGWI